MDINRKGKRENNGLVDFLWLDGFNYLCENLVRKREKFESNKASFAQ